MKRIGFIGGVFLLGLPSLFFSIPGQDRQSQAPLQHEVSVSLKLIQVYVTDKKGTPVQDLAKEDFIVLDSGREVKVTEFEKHLLQPPAPEAAAQPPAEELAPTQPPPARSLSRKYLLFFDFAFNNQRGIQKSIQAALHFLDKELRPGDEVALLSYSMVRGLRFHEYLTTDHAKVKDAIKAITAKAIAGRASEIEEAYWREAQDSVPSSPNYNWQRQEGKAIARQYVLKLTSLAKALRSIEGQKNFIYFSSGLPASMIYGNQAGNPSSVRGPAKYDVGDPVLRPLNEDLYRELSASNCSFFSFDTRDSAKVPSLFDYDEATFEAGGRGPGRLLFGEQGVFQDTTGLFRDDKTTGLDSLKRLSDVTGGKFFSNIRFYPKNLAQVETLTGSFYVLGYYIDETWDGRFHEIKVEVKRKGCQVRAQAGYFNPKPFGESSELEKQLQLFDLALNERSVFRAPKTLSMIALPYEDGTGGRIRMMVKIPSPVLAELAGPKVEFVSLVFDEGENLVDLQRTQTDLARFQGRDLFYSSGARLAPGRYRCRIVVRNLMSGGSAVASIPAGVSKPVPVGLSLQAPLLLVPEISPAHLEGVESGSGAVLSWRNFYPYERMLYAPLIGGASRDVFKICVVVPCSVSGSDQPNIVLAAFLIDAATGAKMAVPFSLVNKERRDTVEIQFLEFPVDGLPAGNYLLYIHAADAASKSISRVQTSLAIQDKS